MTTAELLTRFPDAKKSGSGWMAPCPAHDDRTASLSISEGKDARILIHCHAGCTPEEICSALGLKLSDLFSDNGHAKHNGSPAKSKPAFDWQKCVSDFSEADVQKLVTWRGLSVEFVRWLHQQGIIGIFEGKTAFANHGDSGKVVSAHVRLGKGNWKFDPKGYQTAPLAFGDTKIVRRILAFESQWDAFAVMDKFGWHVSNGSPDTAVFVTRGAANGKLIRGHVSPDAVCYAFKQNDQPTEKKPIPAGDEWLADIANNAGCTVLNVATPTPHKDANDWTRAGATADDIQAAMEGAKSVQPAIILELREPGEVGIVASKDETEFEFANRLATTLPPIKTCGSTWHAYTQGTWRKVERASFRPKAQAILPESIRTARREATLLDHLEGRCQFNEYDFAGFYKFGSDGRILINVANGVLSIQPDGKLKLLDQSLDYLFTLRIAAMFNPQADAPVFRRVLGELLPDADDRKLIQLFSGYILLPDCRFESALIPYGEAGRGKSTIAESIANALGVDSVTRLTMSQICDPKSYHVPKLRHAAVNLGTELDAVELGDSATFKAIVSGEAIEARPIWGLPFTMKTACKLMFLANSLPRFKHGTDAELRRTRFLRFDVLPAEKDVNLKTKLASERDGIFLWIVEGLKELLTLPEMPIGGRASRSVLDRFRISNDPCGSFVTLCCQLAPDAMTPKDQLRTAFADFCERHELPPSCGDWFLKSLYERFPQLRETRPCNGHGDRYRAVAGIRFRP